MDWWDEPGDFIIESLTDHDWQARMQNASVPQDTYDACRLMLGRLRTEARKTWLIDKAASAIAKLECGFCEVKVARISF